MRREVEPADISQVARWGAPERLVTPAPCGGYNSLRLPNERRRSGLRDVSVVAMLVLAFCGVMVGLSILGHAGVAPRATDAAFGDAPATTTAPAIPARRRR